MVVAYRLIDARLYSKFLAVQIKAQLDGILPAELPARATLASLTMPVDLAIGQHVTCLIRIPYTRRRR